MSAKTWILAFFIGLLSTGAQASSPCLFIDWYSAPGSGTIGVQVGPNMQFASVNGVSIPFNTVPGSQQEGGGATVRSTSMGCFPSDELLRNGNNTLVANYVYGDGRSAITGQVSATFILNKGNTAQKILCLSEGGAGSANKFECKRAFSLSLREIDPDSAARIDVLTEEARRLLLEADELLKEGAREVAEVKRKLEELSRRNLEELTREELLGVSDKLGRAAEILDGLKKDVAAVRGQLGQRIQDSREEIQAAQNHAYDALLQAGIPVDDPKIYQTRGIDQIHLDAVPVPGLAVSESLFDPEQNIYFDLAREARTRVTAAIARNDRAELDLILEVWTQTMSILGDSLHTRVGTASLNELRAFDTATHQVLDLVHQQIDELGFFKDARIPIDVERAVQVEIAAQEPEKAKRLRDALNEWDGNKRTPQQVLVLESIRGLGASYRLLPEVPDPAHEIRKQLDLVLDEAIDAAKVVARLGLAFSPLHNFVDFCEMVTGKEFCLPGARSLTVGERALSGVGLIIGSGQFWKMVGGAVLGTEMKAIGREAGELLSKSSGLGKAGKKAFFKKLAKLSPKTVPAVEKRGIQVFRRVGKEDLAAGKYDPWRIGPRNVFADHRFTGPGQEGLYVSTRSETAIAEMEYYSRLEKTGDTVGKEMTEVSQLVDLIGLLDLSNAEAVKSALGVEIAELRAMKNIEPKAYEIAQTVGAIAKERGYKGIIFKSAHTDIGENIVLFAGEIGKKGL